MSRAMRLLSVTLVALVEACQSAQSPQAATVPAMRAPAAADVSAREQTADQQVAHVLSRLSFGARPGDVQRIREIGVDRWIDLQLHPERVDDGRTDQFFASFEVYNTPGGELAQKYPPPNVLLNQLGAARGDTSKLTSAERERVQQSVQGTRQMTSELLSGRVARAVMSERQLQEVMTDFWLNHFTVYIQKNPQERYHIADYENRAIRPNALGRFRTLLGAVARSPAMLIYLDNALSQADSNRPHLVSAGGRGGRGGRGLADRPGVGNSLPPGMTPEMARQALANRQARGLNENYGRELLELHTLGVDGGYTQQDVINVARALTGWTVLPPQLNGRGGGRGNGRGAALLGATPGEFFFNPATHDAGDKVVLGHRLAPGRGIDDGEEVLDIVSRHPSTAHYIAFKLARRFVSDAPNPALVDRAAAVFTKTDGDIREVVRTIVTSPEFFSHAAYRSKVKSPFEVVVSAARALSALPDATPRTAQLVGSLGQPIYGHQSPNGWPETGNEWLNTGAILNRINFGTMVGANRLPGTSSTDFPGGDKLKALPLEQQVDGVISAFLGGDVSVDTRTILMNGENPFLKSARDSAATAMSSTVEPDPVMDPGMRPRPGAGGGGGRGGMPPVPMGQLPALKGLAQLVGLAIGSPEFQRR